MWEILENYYEGNVQVRRKKIQLHMCEYELFKMKPHESITGVVQDSRTKIIISPSSLILFILFVFIAAIMCG